MKPSVLALLTLLVAASPAQALLVSVTGTPGSGTTTWTFSGSSTVGGGTITIDDDDGVVSWGWEVGAAFYAGTDFNIDFTITGALITVGSSTYEILGVGAEAENPDELFGIAIDSPALLGSYDFAVGDVLQFSGSATAPVDITQFALGTTTASNWSESLVVVQGTLPVTFQVSHTAAVPIGSSLSLTALGSLILGGMVRRRTA